MESHAGGVSVLGKVGRLGLTYFLRLEFDDRLICQLRTGIPVQADTDMAYVVHETAVETQPACEEIGQTFLGSIWDRPKSQEMTTPPKPSFPPLLLHDPGWADTARQLVSGTSAPGGNARGLYLPYRQNMKNT